MENLKLLSDKYLFLSAKQQHYHENIKFADQKASAVIALNTVVIAGMNTINCFNDATVIVQLLSYTGALLLLFSIMLSLYTVKPRGTDESSGHSDQKGLVDPHRVHRYENPFKYGEDFDKSFLQKEFFDQLYEYLHKLSRINEHKYKKLKISLKFTLAGWGISIIAVILNLLLKKFF